jgi:hypothetical protein
VVTDVKKNSTLTFKTLFLQISGIIAALVCTGCPDSGSGGGGPQPFRPYFVYTTNVGTNDVSEFVADEQGRLSLIGKVPSGGGPISITSNDFYAFVANSSSNTISVFKIDTIGRLDLVKTVPTAATPVSLQIVGRGPGPDNAGIQPWLFCSCGSANKVVIYKIGGNAILTEVARLASGGAPMGIGDFATAKLVANFGSGTMSEYDLGANGWTVLPTSVKVGQGPERVYTSTDMMYVLNTLSSTITELRDVGQSSTVVQVAGSVSTGSHPSAAYQSVFGRAGNSRDVLYVTNRGISTISAFEIQSNGTLQKIGGIDTPSGPLPNDIKGTFSVARNQPVIYELDEGGKIRAYTEGTDRSLTLFDTYDTGGATSSSMWITGNIGAPQVNGTLKIETEGLPNGSVGTPYSQALSISGGTNTQDASWSVENGALPNGLALKEQNGIEKIVGTPTTTGTFTFTLKATQNNLTATHAYTIVISPAGTGGTTLAEFFNGYGSSQDATTNVVIGTTSFGNVVESALSDPKQVNVGPEQLVTRRGSSSGAIIKSFNINPDKTHRWVYVAVGDPNEGYDLIQDSFDAGANPGVGESWVTVYHGIKGLTETTDIYVIPQGFTMSNTPYKLAGMTPLSSHTFFVTVPGTQLQYQIIATEPGQPNSVIAHADTVKLSQGASQLALLDSPTNLPATWYIWNENLP